MRGAQIVCGCLAWRGECGVRAQAVERRRPCACVPPWQGPGGPAPCSPAPKFTPKSLRCSWPAGQPASRGAPASLPAGAHPQPAPPCRAALQPAFSTCSCSSARRGHRPQPPLHIGTTRLGALLIATCLLFTHPPSRSCSTRSHCSALLCLSSFPSPPACPLGPLLSLPPFLSSLSAQLSSSPVPSPTD